MRFALFATTLLSASLASTASAQISSTTPAPVKGAPAVKVLPPKPLAPTGTAIAPVPVGSFLVGGSDNCATADVISGNGTFTVDNTAATSGAPLATCGAIGRDVWFRWTPGTSGVANISTCGGVTGDSVLAVWTDNGGACPTTQIICLDDSCGLQTSINFPVTAGTPVMLEIGGFASQVFSGTFTTNVSAPPPNDNCTAPTVIAGSGPFAFNNAAASAGTQGQTEALCLAFGSTAINNDVWFTWTSSFTGIARLETCGGTIDTKIAAYAGAGCPAAGTAIGCNDDACGLQTRTDFAVVSGGVYTIQLGLYPFTTNGGAGTFTINPFVPPANDSCTGPTVLVGAGPYNFDTTIASTGTEGQTEALCLAFGTTSIYNDVWFTWTAPSTSQFELSLCGGGSNYDSRSAVYPGAGCPTSGSSIACNDDFCGLTTALCFSATAGAQYTIQIGAFGTTGSGSGTFSITPAASGPGGCTAVDDGSSENSVGLTAGGAMGALVGFGTIGQNTAITSIEMAYGTPGFPGGYIPQGPVTVCVWEDPNDDGNPSDAILLYSTTAVVAPGSIDTDVLQNVPVVGSVVASGYFWIGYTVNHNAGEFPCSLDQSGGGGSACGASSAGGSWVFGDTTGIPNLTNLLANNVPVQSMSSVGIPGNWLIHVNCGSGSAGTPYCFGDGTGIACPCGNSGTAGHGCNNSFATGGALLGAIGSASTTTDTIQLQTIGLPPVTTALNFQGTAPVGVAFGDGLRCAGGTVTRLGIRPVTAGTLNFGSGVAGDPLVHVMGVVPPAGGTRHYQVWYRNIAPFCSPSGFNLSNGLTLVWAP